MTGKAFSDNINVTYKILFDSDMLNKFRIDRKRTENSFKRKHSHIAIKKEMVTSLSFVVVPM
jgi:hypothetical protein